MNYNGNILIPDSELKNIGPIFEAMRVPDINIQFFADFALVERPYSLRYLAR